MENNSFTYIKESHIWVNHLDSNENLYQNFKTLRTIKHNDMIWFKLFRNKRRGDQNKMNEEFKSAQKESIESKEEYESSEIFDSEILKRYKSNKISDKFHIDMLGKLDLSKEFMMEKLITEMMLIPNSCLWNVMQPSLDDPTRKYEKKIGENIRYVFNAAMIKRDYNLKLESLPGITTFYAGDKSFKTLFSY